VKLLEKHSIKFLLSIVLLAVLACPDPPENDPPTNPRDYTWTVDTLAYPDEFQTDMENIWGSSEEDVYAVGHCTTIKGTMWHYDGVTWEPVVLAKSIGGNIEGHHNMHNIFGFSENDVWAVGDFSHSFIEEGLVIHYDGMEWQEVTKLPTDRLTAIWGTSSTDLWVGGMYGGLFHFDGTTWAQDSIPIPEAYDTTYFSMFDIIIGNSTDNIYAKYRRQGTAWILHYDGTQWKVIDLDSPYTNKYIWVDQQGKLFSNGTQAVFQWTDSDREVLFTNNDEYYFHQIFGTNDSNIFIYSYKYYEYYGVIHHYNGENLYQYPNIVNAPQLSSGIWANNQNVFIMAPQTQPFPSITTTLIYHGM